MSMEQDKDIERLEEVFSTKIQAVADRVTAVEGRIGGLDSTMDGDMAELWQTLRVGQEQIKAIIHEHASDDAKALGLIQTQMLMRAPAWALSMMVIGASLIGGMATWILNHVK